MARPTDYTDEIGLEICTRLIDGESLRSICRDPKMPARRTVYYWLVREENKEFLHQYDVAVELRAEDMFDEMLEIADDGTNDYMEKKNRDGSTYDAIDSEHITRSKARIDTRKWILSKMLPKRFGDRIHQEHSGDVTLNAADELILALSGDEDKGCKCD